MTTLIAVQGVCRIASLGHPKMSGGSFFGGVLRRKEEMGMIAQGEQKKSIVGAIKLFIVIIAIEQMNADLWELRWRVRELENPELICPPLEAPEIVYAAKNWEDL
ncbi:MAG: hypothetical protein ACOC6B_07120 [Thermodesulfobacteriota bacterium]